MWKYSHLSRFEAWHRPEIYQIDRNEMYNSLTWNNLFQALQHLLLFVYSECQHLGLKGLPEIVVTCLYQTLLNSHLVFPGESSSGFPTQVKFISDCVDVLQTLESVALCNGEDLLCLIELRHMALFACSISVNQNLPVLELGHLTPRRTIPLPYYMVVIGLFFFEKSPIKMARRYTRLLASFTFKEPCMEKLSKPAYTKRKKLRFIEANATYTLH